MGGVFVLRRARMRAAARRALTLAILAGLAQPFAARAEDPAPRLEPARAPSGCEPSRPEAIVRLGTRSWSLDRELVAWFARHPGEASRIAWVRRERGPDGMPLGYLLGGIRCGSELHLAGLRNGDVLRSVNGRPVRSLPEAVVTLLALKGAEVLEVEVLRSTGEVEVLLYTLS